MKKELLVTSVSHFSTEGFKETGRERLEKTHLEASKENLKLYLFENTTHTNGHTI